MGKTESKAESNVYMRMPLVRVRQDAEAGVSLARAAYGLRQPAEARKLGIGVDASQQRRVLKATKDFYRAKRRR